MYTQPQCEYSSRVFDVMRDMGLEVESRDIRNPLIEKELIQRGGKVQTPYFVDTDTLVEMYEADDIVDYLMQEYGDA